MANNKSNSKRIKIHLKKGDNVKVIAGKDKGKTGEILEMYPKTYRAVVDGVNIAKKHMKPTQDNPGGIQDLAMPIHISNLMLIDPKSGNPTKVGRRVEGDKIVRYAKVSGETIK